MYKIIYFIDENTGLTWYVADFSILFGKPSLKLTTSADEVAFVFGSAAQKITELLPALYDVVVLDSDDWMLIKRGVK